MTFRPVVSKESLTPVTEANAARWAMEFASSSYGDALLASAVAMLLLPQMPPGVQVSRLIFTSVLRLLAHTQQVWSCTPLHALAFMSTLPSRLYA